MDQATLKELKEALIKERERLVEELKSIAAPDPRMAGDWDAKFPQFETVGTGSHSSRDEAAEEVEEYEMRLAAEHSLESRLLEVNKALERMEQETYGICTKCGKQISLERIRANPAAEFDLNHK